MNSVEVLQWKDFSQWTQHCGDIFGIGAAYFNRHYVNDPHRDMDSIFVIKDGDIIASTVRVFHRQVNIAGHTYKMGGIGEVSTKEQYRAQKMSYDILNHCMDYMRKNGFELSMLGTGYFGHYRKHGFEQVPVNNVTVKGGAAAVDADIRPLEFSCDTSAAYKLYRKYSRLRNCTIARTFDYFACWSVNEFKNPHGLFRDGEMVGYICFDGNRSTELICSDADCDALLGVVPPDENGNISAHAYVKTTREVVSTSVHDSWMANVITPFKVDGHLMENTSQFVEYLKGHDGIVMFDSDGF